MITKITVGMAAFISADPDMVYIIDHINDGKTYYLRGRYNDLKVVARDDMGILHMPFVIQTLDDTVIAAESLTAFIQGEEISLPYSTTWDSNCRVYDILQEMATALFIVVQQDQTYQMIPASQIKRFFVHEQFLKGKINNENV